MFKNYFKIAWRNLMKNKVSSIINISGLAVGIAVALLIGLWIWDEISFDKDNKNYDRIAKVMQNQNLNGEEQTWEGLPHVLAEALRTNFKDDFKTVSIFNWATSILNYNNKPISQDGLYVDANAPAMLDLKMEEGNINALQDPSAILISASAAKAIFNKADPINKTVKVENIPAKIAGVYKDMPANSTFANQNFITSWAFKTKIAPWILTMDDPWGTNNVSIYVQLADHADLKAVSAKIKDLKLKNIRADQRIAKPELFLQPMSKWHLYAEFKNGINTGGRIQYVWWFGIIGLFVLLLACINFMNLSTARSEKRAKEMGIRKAVGSLRQQLIKQFLSESVLTAFLAFIISILLVQLSLPFFNTIADKQMQLPWNNFYFWLIAIAFTLFTGIVAGSYPAFYLSGFNPVKVLKGTFSAGRFSSLPRKALVVIQFTVSVILIIGTVVIYRQIQFAKNRPLGYNSNGLVTVSMHLYDVHSHFGAIENDLKNSGAVINVAQANSPLTEVWSSNGGMSWSGKAPGTSNDFPMIQVSQGYGKTVGWQIVQGRDFSKDFPSDSAAFVLNESAVKFMGFKNPIGQQVAFNDGVAFTVIGVVKDFVMESPYAPVRPSMFRLLRNNDGMLVVKLNPKLSAHDALAKISAVLKTYDPSQALQYKFVDEQYAKKFGDEERVGNLATGFAVLAIFISCLGLFGLASFVAERRTKEIGVRKVLGASVFNLWKLLSKDFVVLVLISLLIAIPVAYYFMHNWLQNYEYRTTLSWWIFAVTGFGALLITLLTVSFQSIKAAIANPVKSLRTE
ncbi:MAG TPA: ABC transporter permease [Parafilimonas sp.]|nr:ABC transporter permease [Parafilimonas sp.]